MRSYIPLNEAKENKTTTTAKADATKNEMIFVEGCIRKAIDEAAQRWPSAAARDQHSSRRNQVT
ncbi:MAG TPA: hypothetical protein VFD48_16490 [Pyrinomonadaceae bacterium]|nr:hypothetical protein [Pyrinomonadaceae bacterium]